MNFPAANCVERDPADFAISPHLHYNLFNLPAL